MDPLIDENTKLIRHYGFEPQQVQGMGPPEVIHQADLQELAPLWLRYTEMLRDDPVSHELTNPWIVDMWGYVFAAVSLGLRHRVEPLAYSPKYTREDVPDDLPLVHYCERSITDLDTGWSWAKRSYQPWTHVPVPPAGTTRPTYALIDLLNEYGAHQGNVLLPPSTEEMGILVNGSLSEEAVTEIITEILPDLQQCIEEFGSESSGFGLFLLIVTPDGTVETATLQKCTKGFEGACSGFAASYLAVVADGVAEKLIPVRDRLLSASKPEAFIPRMLEHFQKLRFPSSSGKTVVIVPVSVDDGDE